MILIQFSYRPSPINANATVLGRPRDTVVMDVLIRFKFINKTRRTAFTS